MISRRSTISLARTVAIKRQFAAMGKTTRDFSFPESLIANEKKVDLPFASKPIFRRHQSSVAEKMSKKKFVSRKAKKFVPRKAAVELTDRARTLFQKLLENHPTRDGILLNYNQSSTGEPRMVFSFSFVNEHELDEQDEGVSLEVDADGNPKTPRDALDDGLPKLYVHHNAFLKVLGAKVDVDTENLTPILYDKEGFELDANA